MDMSCSPLTTVGTYWFTGDSAARTIGTGHGFLSRIPLGVSCRPPGRASPGLPRLHDVNGNNDTGVTGVMPRGHSVADMARKG